MSVRKKTAAAIRVLLIFLALIGLIAGITLGLGIGALLPPKSTTSIQTTTITASYSTSFTTIYTKTSTITVGFSPFNGPNNGTWYMSNSGGCGSDNGMNTPCWSASLNDSYIFDCLASASTISGCTREIVNPSRPDVSNYTVTIWYPPTNQTSNAKNTFPYYADLANCIYGQSIPTGQTYHEQSFYAFCVPLNQTSFIVTQPDDPNPV